MGFLRKDQLHLCHSGKSLQHTVSQNVSKNKRFVQLLVLGFFLAMLHGIWDLPQPGIKSMPLALEAQSLITGR